MYAPGTHNGLFLNFISFLFLSLFFPDHPTTTRVIFDVYTCTYLPTYLLYVCTGRRTTVSVLGRRTPLPLLCYYCCVLLSTHRIYYILVFRHQSRVRSAVTPTVEVNPFLVSGIEHRSTAARPSRRNSFRAGRNRKKAESLIEIHTSV